MNTEIDKWLDDALNGHQKSVEYLMAHVEKPIYNLALRMLLFPEDAKDATQEILIKILTHLGSFERRSSFKTWTHQIAINYLCTHKGNKSRQFEKSFEDYESFIDTGISDKHLHARNEGELALLEEEVKISCTHGLLLCLRPLDRAVYILGDILEINSYEGSEILEITAENYRQKLSRSRKRIRSFLQKKCGIINKRNPCRCRRKIDFLHNQGLISKQSLRFASPLHERTLDLIEAIQQLEKSSHLYRQIPDYDTPEELQERILKIIHHDS